jgi:hypothetical protein
MKDAYWFKHDSNARNDERIIDLLSELGYAGYGIFWALIEYLRDNENYEAEYKPKRLARALQEQEDLIEQVINGYGLFVVDSEKFYSISLKARMKEMDIRRDQQREKANKRWHPDGKKESDDESQSNAVALPEQYHKNREEEIREKKKKKDKITPEERVQGEKGESSFFSQCLEKRNSYPVILLFEYVYFVGTSTNTSLEENRQYFLTYCAESKNLPSGEEIRKRLLYMGVIGFNMEKKSVNDSISKLIAMHGDDMKEENFYMKFLEVLKTDGKTPEKKLQELAQPFFSF